MISAPSSPASRKSLSASSRDRSGVPSVWPSVPRMCLSSVLSVPVGATGPAAAGPVDPTGTDNTEERHMRGTLGHTLGTPDLSLDEALRLFREAGLDGAEIIWQDGYRAAI